MTEIRKLLLVLMWLLMIWAQTYLRRHDGVDNDDDDHCCVQVAEWD